MGGKRAQAWMRRVERLLLAIAAMSLAWYATVHIEASREQAALSEELDRSRATLASPPPAAAPSAKPIARSYRNAAPPRVAKHASAAPADLLTRIEIPRLRLSTIAREGIDLRTLRASAGHVPGSALPGETGNAAFAAHRDTFFRPLKHVREGDEIRVTTPDGVFTYVVSATQVVEPEDVSVLRATPTPTLTLVTCYPFDYLGSAPQRFIVSAQLVR
jgi:sortase A